MPCPSSPGWTSPQSTTSGSTGQRADTPNASASVHMAASGGRLGRSPMRPRPFGSRRAVGRGRVGTSPHARPRFPAYGSVESTSPPSDSRSVAQTSASEPQFTDQLGPTTWCDDRSNATERSAAKSTDRRTSAAFSWMDTTIAEVQVARSVAPSGLLRTAQLSHATPASSTRSLGTCFRWVVWPVEVARVGGLGWGRSVGS